MASTARGITLFATDIGSCGVAWGPRGIVGVRLPEASDRLTLSRLAEASGGAEPAEPPRAVKSAIDKVRRHLAGERVDLSGIALDLDGQPPLRRRIYEALRGVPAGQTVTYGELAVRAGSTPMAARSVGTAMARNPFPVIVPCHRVVGAGGAAGGFSAHGGLRTKARLLAIEGVALDGKPAQPAQDDKKPVTSEEPVRSADQALFFGAGTLPYDGEAAVRALCQKDRKLARLIAKVGPLRLQPHTLDDTFEALAHSIIYQQLSGKAAATILGRLQAHFPERRLRAVRYLALDEATVRGAGVSGGKHRALTDLAEKSLAGVVPRVADLARLPDDEIVERLRQVRGVGRWTVEMLLIFRLSRPDVLPATDLGVRKGYQVAFGGDELPAPAALLAHGERWRPFRSVAAWYLWRATEL